ncbi:AraC family transcriptional regulator [Nitratireductor sp. XY-223]|uniref:AraC family transcriptional regulator n=1 Tax=Nitratireductor sp. XY-223 TaxID=2561926 RepID=UPI0010AAF107|nr:AraC family transcriptional regulator [Nitratireductor sp. XY-223]
MSTDYDKRIMRVLKYIHDNPAGDLSLDALADVAAMSRFHWHRVFHAMTGETCAQAVRRLRLYRAALWLIGKDWPVAAIAAKVGYPNVNSFSRAFQDQYGVSPRSFRMEGFPAPTVNALSKGDSKMFDVEIRKTEIQRLAALHHQGPYAGIGPCFRKLWTFAPELGSNIRGIAAVHYDDPNVVAEADLKSCAGFIVSDDTMLPKGLDDVILDGGDCAVLTYKGPYGDIRVAYDHLFGHWLPGSGREPADAPCYEVYLNDPADTKPEDLLTEIRLPLAA